MTEQILKDIENGLCITIDAENYIVYNSEGEVLHRLKKSEIEKLSKEGKVKIVEQATSYIVEFIDSERTKEELEEIKYCLQNWRSYEFTIDGNKLIIGEDEEIYFELGIDDILTAIGIKFDYA